MSEWNLIYLTIAYIILYLLLSVIPSCEPRPRVPKEVGGHVYLMEHGRWTHDPLIQAVMGCVSSKKLKEILKEQGRLIEMVKGMESNE